MSNEVIETLAEAVEDAIEDLEEEQPKKPRKCRHRFEPTILEFVHKTRTGIRYFKQWYCCSKCSKAKFEWVHKT